MKFRILIVCFSIALAFTANAQWTQLAVPGAGLSYNCSYFKNTSEGFIAGENRIYRTMNGGTSWDTVSYGNQYAILKNCIVENIHFINDSEGVACGYNPLTDGEIVFKTLDSGATWNSIAFQGTAGTHLYDMFFSSATTGYCVGKGGRIIKTADGGDTWSPLTSGVANDLHGVYFIGNDGWIAGDNTILKTINSGTSWTSLTFFNKNLKDLYFTTPLVGYVASTDVYKTFNAGATYTPVLTTMLFDANDIYATNTDTLFIAENGNILKSNNAGASWFAQSSAPLTKNYTSVRFVNAAFGIATTANGEVYKTTTNGDPVQQNDAGIISIAAQPTTGCLGNYPINVRLKNFGQANLTQARIDWKVNGIAQSPFIYSGNLPYDSVATVTIGSFNFTEQTNTIVAYTTQENNVADYIHHNDTASVNYVFPSLSGIYTIGGSNPDFATVDSAFNTLNTFGSCGNITFRIRNGIYNVTSGITNYSKNSSADSLIITSSNGDSSQVLLDFGSGHFDLDNAKNVTLSRISISSYNTGTIWLIDSVRNINILNCYVRIIGPSGSSIAHFGDALTNLRIQNCLIRNGGSGFTSVADTTDQISIGMTINNCVFDSSSGGGIYIEHGAGISITGNYFTGVKFRDYNAIGLSYCNNGFIISANRMITDKSGSLLGFLNCENTPGNEGVVRNNFLSVTGTLGTSLLSLIHSSNIKFYYNTFRIGNGTGVVIVEGDTLTPPQYTFQNNIVSNTSSSRLFDITVPTGTKQSFYTSIFKTIGNNAYSYLPEYDPGFTNYFFNLGTFDYWKGLFGGDNSSVYSDPQYTDSTDYKVYPNSSNVLLDGNAKPIAGIVSDIEGKMRNASSPDIGCYEFNLFNNDAGVNSVSTAGLGCDGVKNVKVTIADFGSSSISSVTINWSVNGITQTPFIYNGNLSTLDSTLVTIGTYNFAASTLYTLKAWTSFPNTSPDPNKANDTAIVELTTLANGMSGTYTIGGAAPDFNGVDAAITALSSNGICDNVTFNIRPGAYLTSVLIPAITGAGPDKVIEFKSENNDSSSVIIWTNSGTIFTFNFGSGYLSFKHLTINDSTTSGSGCFSAFNKFHHINLENCSFYKPIRTIFSSNNFPANYITIKNCLFYSGYEAIRISSSVGTVSHNVVIDNNIFIDQKDYAVYLTYTGNLAVKKNRFTRQAVGSGAASLHIQFAPGQISVTENYFNVTGIPTAIYINNQGTPAIRSVIANNMISMSAASSARGLYMGGCIHTLVAYNSIALASNVSGTGMDFTNGENNEVYNNSVSASGLNGIALSVQYNPTDVFDYNNYYTGNKLPFYDFIEKRKDIDEWRVFNGQDMHSHVGDPMYISATDLHTNLGFNLLDNAKSLSLITKDIDGDVRSLTTPDIGADEFSAPLAPVDAGVYEVVYNGDVCSGIHPVKVVLRNYGTNVLSSATIHWTVNGILQPQFTYAGSLASLQKDTVTIGNYNLSEPDSFTIVAWTSDPNNTVDGYAINDTAKLFDFHSRLTGTYTIGGVNPDFTTIESARYALVNYGVCGPVIFNIRNGTYNGGQNSITGVNGASSVNTITFQSESGDSSAVTINAIGLNNTAFFFYGAHYFKLNQLTINGTGTGDAVKLSNGSSNCTVSNCRNTKNINISAGCNYNVIENNLINGQVLLNDNFGPNSVGNTIRNNIINYYDAVYCYHQDSLIIERNVITNTYLVNPGGPGIEIHGGDSRYRILNNRISGNYSTGIYIGQSGRIGDTAIVANNIVVTGNNCNYGVNISTYSNYLKFIYNTVLIPATSSGIPFNFVSPLDNGVIISNNLFTTYDTDPAVSWPAIVPGVDFKVDRNNYYTTGFNLIRVNNNQFYDLTQFQSAYPAYEQNSSSLDPQLSVASGLYPHNPLLHGTGIPISGVTDDINGKPRSSTNPTMGAMEELNDSLVWPGDANYDGVANNYDLLSVGLYFNQSGTARATVSNAWAAQPSTDWGVNQYMGMDKKHADCNGDGTINWSDTTAIKQNWGLSHPFNRPSSIYISALADLYFDIDSSSYDAGDTVNVKILAGNVGSPVAALYGISFDIGYDVNLIQPGSMKLTYNPCWLGVENVNAMTSASVSTQASGSVVRINGTDTTGYGIIGQLQFVIDPTLTSASTFVLSFSNYLAVTANGSIIQFNALEDSLQIIPVVSVDENVSLQQFDIYPNPANDEVRITYSLNETSEVTIELHNVTGELIQSYKENQSAGKNTYLVKDLKNLSKGIYFVKVIVDGVVSARKLVIE